MNPTPKPSSSTTAATRRKAGALSSGGGSQQPKDLGLPLSSLSFSQKPPPQLAHNNNNKTTTTAQRAALCLLQCSTGPTGLASLACLTVAWALYSIAHSHVHLSEEKPTHQHAKEKLLLPFMKHKEWIAEDHLKTADELLDLDVEWKLPDAFDSVLARAQEKKAHCTSLQSDFAGFDASYEVPFGNDTVASLPSFGIVEHLEQFRNDPNGVLLGEGGGEETLLDPRDWHCTLPPETECDIDTLTAVFMAYNPDRLQKTLRQIKIMLTDASWTTLIDEVVLVWNGPRSVDESKEGQDLLAFAQTHPKLRVVYPLLDHDLDNDLMNRYHPHVLQLNVTQPKQKAKALLYYDDDGPFYSFAAVQAGLELWKRHSRSQVGAMARELTYGPRQRQEHQELLQGQHANDRGFVSHCTNVQDKVDYNYRYFANYDANMVLPSGSILHSNYLCFLWHPVLEPIRQFVRNHPVHPDDVTVSTIVSQLGGRAPRVYSRRLVKEDDEEKDKGKLRKRKKGRPQQQSRRRLSTRSLVNNASSTTTLTTTTLQVEPPPPPLVNDNDDEDDDEELDDLNEGLIPAWEYERHRRLMFSICWDCKGGMDEKKKIWAALRTEAINALTRYFGSLNSGSIGWCEEGSPYYSPKVDGRCQPNMAKVGWLSWMNPDGSPKETCP